MELPLGINIYPIYSDEFLSNYNKNIINIIYYMEYFTCKDLKINKLKHEYNPFGVCTKAFYR